MEFSLDRNRLIRLMKEQAAIGETDAGGLNRVALSDADKRVRDWFLNEMEAAGLTTRIDEFGNMFGRRSGTDATAPAILLGSHLDSQPFGGIYDGALGVVAALEVVLSLNDANIDTKRPIEIVNWTNEEGARFQSVMQGSGVWAGELDLETEHAVTDSEGRSVESELERIGYKGTTAAEPTTEYSSAVELHIEQGTRMEEANADVGVVTGVFGLSWGSMTFSGEANHTGTTPMGSRENALIAAADTATATRRMVDTLGQQTVGTVGHIEVNPNSINIIPGEVTITWDIRDPSDDTVELGRERVLAEAQTAANREGVELEWQDRSRSESVRFAPLPVDTAKQVASKLDYDSIELFSGATHDAVNVASICDSAMIFAVSEDGKSHTEEEYTSWDDCYKPAEVLGKTAVRLANR